MTLNILKKRDLLTLCVDGFNLEKTIWEFVHRSLFIHFIFSKSLLLESI